MTSLKLTHKLGLLVLLPLAALLLFASLYALASYRTMANAADMVPITRLAAQSGQLAHQLQAERGLSASSINDSRGEFGARLAEQRARTEQALRRLEQGSRQLVLEGEAASRHQALQQALGRLEGLRRQVDGKQLTVPQVVDDYSQVIAALLAVIDGAVPLAADAPQAAALGAYSAFLQAKDRLGLLRASLSSARVAGQFSPELYRRFAALEAQHQAYLERFMVLAEPQWRAQFGQLQGSPLAREVQDSIDQAHRQHGGGSLSGEASAWFSLASRYIDAIKGAEDQFAASLAQTGEQGYQAARNSFFLALVLSLAAALLTLLVCGLILRDLRRGFAELQAGIMRIAHRQDFSQPVRVASRDELGELADAINRMQCQLSTLLGRMRDTCEHLMAHSGHTRSTLQLIQQDLDKGLGQVDLVVSAATEMSATVAEIARHASETFSAANHTIARASDGDRKVDGTIAAIEQVAASLEHGEAKVVEVAGYSREVSNFLEVIKQISDRTNLLALNAAIEAARAGESGRGFAVVAEEVRSLALQTQSTAEQIESMLTRLRQGSEQAVEAMGQGRSRSLACVGEAREAGAQLTAIVEEIGQVNAMTEQVATATEEQRTVTDDIQHNIVVMKQGYDNTQSCAGELVRGSELMAQMVVELDGRLKAFILGEGDGRPGSLVQDEPGWVPSLQRR
ncbi:methyl-accepting chemotaxis protein [Zobellella sp. An-6]|uniref:methyl-accepting chemotaxis protein n=1 Tax=Zobellella sp. An-6 TaxID=3400218 RepID=UPI004042B084